MYSRTNFTLLLLAILVNAAATALAQTPSPRTVCQITASPVNRDHVTTKGKVASVVGDDDFWISDGGCSIKCEVADRSRMPSVGQDIVVYGYVEVDDDDDDVGSPQLSDDELEIDV